MSSANGSGGKSIRDIAIDAATAAVAGAITSGIVGAAVGVGTVGAQELLRRLLVGDTEAVVSAVEMEQIEAIRERAAEIDACVERLEREDPANAPSGTAVIAVLRAFGDAWKETTDPGKRRLLSNALVASFEPEIYYSGEAKRLFALMRELTFGEIEYLNEIVDSEDLFPSMEKRRDLWATLQSSLGIGQREVRSFARER